MVFEHIKKRITRNLIEEIKCLDPVGLELVGHNAIAIIEKQGMIHHGINKDYKPCGYTVDSFSNDSAIVGEYSTESGYFESKGTKEDPIYEKINKDIWHAMSHKKPDGPNKIYLISNQEEPPSFRSTFNATQQGRTYGKRLIIIDARELAKEVYEQSITNSMAAEYYKSFFPGFAQDLDNFEYFGKLPAPCDKHVREIIILNAIKNHYEYGESICILHGVSGSGKTQAAIDFIRHKGTDFQNYIWISGEDWKPDTSLSAVQRCRGGAPINVAGLFNSTKTILVIDGIERKLEKVQFEELSSGFDNGGVVLATSQLAVPQSPLYLSIPRLSKEVAFKILGEAPVLISEGICDDFVEACSFSPLILSTTRNLVEMENISREEIYGEILDDPEAVLGADGTSIMRKILGKLEPRELKALKKIANSGINSHDINFLRFFLGINPCSNLQRLSILMPTNTVGVVNIHDLVSRAAQDEVHSGTIAEAIEEYINKERGEMTPSVLRQIHLSRNQIYEEHLLRGQREDDWLTYALLQCEGELKIDIHKALCIKEITPDLSLSSVMCIIDAKEVQAYTITNNDERQAYYEKCVEIFEKALNELYCNEVRAELLHHRAKALRRCGRYKDALKCFLQLLELKPNWHAVHGQIAHLGTQSGVDNNIRSKGEESMRKILDEILRDASFVPLRVSLAALARLRSYHLLNSEISADPEKVKKLADIIAMSSLEGLDQFYEAFVSFTSIFNYRHSSCCVVLAEALPEMIAITPEQVEKKQWVSACESLSNTAIAASREQKVDISSRIADASIKFADAICEAQELRPFDARAVAKAYITANIPLKALEVIDKVAKDKIDHWLLYRKSEALLALENYTEALISAKESLQMIERDAKAVQRISIYYSLLSKIYEALGDNHNALKEAKLALHKCTNEQYKMELLNRVSRLENL